MFGIDYVFGLPLHALVVHFAVVLGPLAVIAFMVTGLRPEWRRNYSCPVAILAIFAAGAAFIAAQSGGPLRRNLREQALRAGTRADFGDHPGNGQIAEILAIIFAIIAVAAWISLQAYDYRRVAANVLYVVGCAVGALALAAMIVAGHSGAVLVWKDLGNFVSG